MNTAAKILTPGELKRFLGAVAPRRPVLVWGPAGSGKSGLAADVAAALELPLVRCDLERLRALVPDASLDALGSSQGFHAPRMTARPRPVLLLVEGMESADARGARALREFLQRRRLDGYRLPEGSLVVAEGRCEGDALPALPEELSGWLVQVRLEPVIEDWLAWARREALAPEIRRHLEHHPEQLFVHAPGPGPVSSPRSWHALAELLGSEELRADPVNLEAAARGLLSPSHAQGLLRALVDGKTGTIPVWPKKRKPSVSTSSGSRRRTAASGSTG